MRCVHRTHREVVLEAAIVQWTVVSSSPKLCGRLIRDVHPFVGLHAPDTVESAPEHHLEHRGRLDEQMHAGYLMTGAECDQRSPSLAVSSTWPLCSICGMKSRVTAFESGRTASKLRLHLAWRAAPVSNWS